MAWIKLDVNFLENPKIDALSDPAKLLHIWALCYSGRQLTDGFIPSRQVLTAERTDLVTELVRAGLWIPVTQDVTQYVTDGYQIHDYLKYQTSKDKVEAVREATRERVEKFRESKRVTQDVTPLVTHTEEKRNRTRSRKETNADSTNPDFEIFWELYPRKDSKKPAFESFKKALKKTSFDDLMAGLTRYVAFLKTATQNPAMATTWLNQERWTDQLPTPLKPKGQNFLESFREERIIERTALN